MSNQLIICLISKTLGQQLKHLKVENINNHGEYTTRDLNQIDFKLTKIRRLFQQTLPTNQRLQIHIQLGLNQIYPLIKDGEWLLDHLNWYNHHTMEIILTWIDVLYQIQSKLKQKYTNVSNKELTQHGN